MAIKQSAHGPLFVGYCSVEPSCSNRYASLGKWAYDASPQLVPGTREAKRRTRYMTSCDAIHDATRCTTGSL